jgi:glycosyltransferase involved in cell wall biosynthesis
MKVAFVFMHPFSESMGSAVRVRELAKSLGQLNVEVYILTPYERSSEIFPNVHVVSLNHFINTIRLSRPIYNFSKFLYYSRQFPSLFSRGAAQSNRILDMVVVSISKFLIENHVDILQVEQDVALPIGLALKKLTGLPVVADIHNISSEELVANNIVSKNSQKFAKLQSRTRDCLSQVDHVVVVSEKMRDYVLSNYDLASNKVSVVPPGGRVSACKPCIKKYTNYRKVVYAGLVAKREHVDLFAKSIPIVLKKNAGVQFYITDKGEAIQELKHLSKTLKIRPHFFWFEDYTSANRFLSSCDIGVLPSSPDIARVMGTPAKLFNYLSMGLPIVANDVGGWSEIIEREEVGVIAKDDPKDFAEKILYLLENPLVAQKYALNGLNLIRSKYNWDLSAKILLSVYERFSPIKECAISSILVDDFHTRGNISNSVLGS